MKGTCPYYRPNKKVRYAAGFVSLLESLPHKQMLSVIPGLMRHFSRRTYYRVRKGERPLSPSEQQVVLNALKRCGVKRAKRFRRLFLGVRLVNQGREACATTHVTNVPIAWHIIGTTKYY
ncbi:DUF6078 family protein [Parabacteroides distasonis]|nr:DUF6078 family protein [Parabacteroides distasonis]